jgi:hypothetical protein
MDPRSLKPPANVGSIHIIESFFVGYSKKTGSRLREVIEPLAGSGKD